MLVHPYLRILRRFSADDPKLWTYKHFITNIERSSNIIIKCMSPSCCSDLYTDLFCTSIDPFYSHNIFYFFMHIFTLQHRSLCSLYVIYIHFGKRKIAFLTYFNCCHGIKFLLTVFIEIVHMFINEYGLMDQACIMDQEFEEIQCECSNSFSWKFCRHNDNCIYTCMYLRNVLFCTLCNDLFTLKKNRYKFNML